MRRKALFINRASPVPLRRQLESAIRDAINSGILRPGERMMSSREMRTHLGVSRNTITEALGQLESEGYLVTRRGAGTFVSSIVAPDKRRRMDRAFPIVPSTRAKRFLAAQEVGRDLEGGLAFRPGIPALDSFPLATFRACIERADWSGDLLDYPQRGGLPSLRLAIAKRVRQTRGIVCEPEQVFITTGAQSAFSLAFHVLLHEGDSVAIEDPCYPNVLALLRSFNLDVVPIPVDSEGIIANGLCNVRAKALYVTPSHQYPTGGLLNLSRRLDILAWANEQGAWIIEDDYDSEFNYSGKAHPTFQSLDDARRVLYVGSFSKVLSPALRIGYIVVPETLCAAFAAAHEIIGGAPSVPLQAGLARFIERGHLGRHISKMRKRYDARRQFLTAYLSSTAPSLFTIRDSASGLHFVAELPPEVEDVKVQAAAAKVGIVARALSEYYIREPRLNGIVFGYAAVPIPDAEAAANLLISQIVAFARH